MPVKGSGEVNRDWYKILEIMLKVLVFKQLEIVDQELEAWEP